MATSEDHYETPPVPTLLIISSFLYLINVADVALAQIINAGLIGPLLTGIIFGPQVAGILPENVQQTFVVLGYIGLLLLVFEAGLSTNIRLLFSNIMLSVTVALTGVLLPISLSLLLLHFGYQYSVLQAFGAGAALCSTSLGTTLALLRPELRQTRTGIVLMSAALLDDIAGLVVAAIIPNLPSPGSGASISWKIIARPILVSLGFAFGTPVFAYIFQKGLARISWRHRIYAGRIQLFLLVVCLLGFVAGAKYAGTSELFGAYLAGAFITHAVGSQVDDINGACFNPAGAFSTFLAPILQFLLSPIFFASIGIALPIRSLFSVGGSQQVIWRGLLYSLLMILAKATVGLWILVWPNALLGRGWFGTRDTRKPPSEAAYPAQLSTRQSAALVGMGMVARGEIALIVAQLARPILLAGQETSEPFAVVVWGVLVSTISGAVGVGVLLKRWA